MANWQKIITSGSAAELSSLTADGTVTAGGFTTTGTWTMDTSAAGTAGITNINVTNAFTDDDVTIMSAGAIKEKIESYSYLTSVDISDDTNLVAGTNITLTDDTLSVDDVFLKNNASDTTTGTITAAGFTTTGTVNAGSAVISGDLTVNGTTTTLATANLAVGDAFIFAATGSAADNVDAGLIVQSGSAVDSGSAIYHDIDSQRWAVAKQIASDGTSVLPSQNHGFVVTIKSLNLGGAAPGKFDNTYSMDSQIKSASYGVGEIIMDSSGDKDIWILGN